MTLAAPICYETRLEEHEKGEQDTIRALNDTMQGINDTTSGHYGRAVRPSFAKSFALLEGKLTVLSNLPDHFAQGLFSREASYPVVLRMSTAPGDILPDDISTARGLAIKISGVEGERLSDSEEKDAQDFIFINSSKFLTETLKALNLNIAGLAATTDKVEGLKKVTSWMMQGVEKVIESLGAESVNIKHTGGQLPVHPLGDTYNTLAPVLYGNYMAKLRIVPSSENVAALTGKKIDLHSGRPDALREESSAFFKSNTAIYELQVQLCTDIEAMPIENSGVEWAEEKSPFTTVARIEIEPQVAWSEEKSRRIDDCMASNPWNALAAHRPIGNIMRARKQVYSVSSSYRARFNGCPFHAGQTTQDGR